MKDPAEQAAIDYDRQEQEAAAEDAQVYQDNLDRLLRRRIAKMVGQVDDIEREAIRQQLQMSGDALAYLRTCGVM